LTPLGFSKVENFPGEGDLVGFGETIADVDSLSEKESVCHRAADEDGIGLSQSAI
jgi:hypothetical protein